MRRLATSALVGILLATTSAAPALACGGLVAPNGSVNLLRTTTLAAYHEGVEHYVTSFEFLGGGAEFGSIVPLPGIPSKVTRGGDWTLQRLAEETALQFRNSVALSAVSTDAESAKVLYETEIDGLDITILEGGAVGVGNWAQDNGFNLSPDAPEVLDFYARRSPIFMAVRFDPRDSDVQDLAKGDGVPIHLRIPTPDPWVPLRILALGKSGKELVEADVYLLTDHEPALLPQPVDPGSISLDGAPGLVLDRSEPASDSLLSDLRSDKGMKWMPKTGMWLTYLRLDTRARDLTYDLAIEASGIGQPSAIEAGLAPPHDFVPPELPPPSPDDTKWLAWALLPFALLGAIAITNRFIARVR